MTQPPSVLPCPKCGAEMRSYERNGVTIDQCSGCRGIFLDRGELERLIDAEGAYYGAGRPSPSGPAPMRPAPPYPDDPGRGYDRGHSDKHGDKHGYRRDEYGGRRKRGGFLGELFD